MVFTSIDKGFITSITQWYVLINDLLHKTGRFSITNDMSLVSTTVLLLVSTKDLLLVSINDLLL